MRINLILLFSVMCMNLISSEMYSQSDIEKEFNAQYERNIKKSRINGVYIPRDMSEAFDELIALSEKESLEKFASASEDTVARKLHFGLGRWIGYNWNFYEGSRFSHYLKSLGLSHPDDMIQLVITSFHRHLNNRELALEQRAQAYNELRQEKLKAKQEVLKSETRVRQKN